MFNLKVYSITDFVLKFTPFRRRIWNLVQHFVGNKAKERISKLLFQENEARKIFRKTKFFYPLIRKRRCEYQGVRNISFSKNWRALFS